ncbi:thiol:disulfide interchange protein DsbA/DsbL [Pandoraea oxalativorans]|uniref:Thiol:disulfide interchange protein DsbA n=1 Tax=Pandoraea oxalativorans TaxID=573737 RepID=A0A0E3YAC2_9BURK|nr:thiol:disulfide interchange protein DsbA/DsbL [Pandoraea oxalativorans]AKC69231.1 disulfide bond formation protein DsbA [Pandoraea oxalativorans]
MKKLLGAVLISFGFLSGVASASPEAPVAGTDYLTIPQQPLTAGPGKIEVTEFFWYGCPHCSALEPTLEKWVKAQGKDVVFKRVPVAFRSTFEPHTRMFIALTTLGKEAELTPKVFNEIHVKHNYLLTRDSQADFLATLGVDKAAYSKAYDAAGAPAMARKESPVDLANKAWKDYKIDGVPTIAIQGKYLVSPATSGDALQKQGKPATTEQQTFDAALKTADSIINQIRAKKM